MGVITKLVKPCWNKFVNFKLLQLKNEDFKQKLFDFNVDFLAFYMLIPSKSIPDIQEGQSTFCVITRKRLA